MRGDAGAVAWQQQVCLRLSLSPGLSEPWSTHQVTGKCPGKHRSGYYANETQHILMHLLLAFLCCVYCLVVLGCPIMHQKQVAPQHPALLQVQCLLTICGSHCNTQGIHAVLKGWRDCLITLTPTPLMLHAPALSSAAAACRHMKMSLWLT